MSIRIRTVNGVRVALCAARSVATPGDVYLDDADHAALASKFMEDFVSEGFITAGQLPPDPDAALRATEESDNPNRAWWDEMYAAR